MAGWASLRKLVECELVQSREEGKDPAAIDALGRGLDRAGGDEAALSALFERLLALPVREDFPFREPSDLEGIRALRSEGPRRLDLPFGLDDDDALFDRMHGAWLGRSAGCALGKPVEGFMRPKDGLTSRERIRRYLTAVSADEWPLSYYFPGESPVSEETGRLGCPKSTREEIAFMESDDDIRYTVLGQVVMAKRGRGFTTLDVARRWEGSLPYEWVCTAETQAYRNLVIRYPRGLGDGVEPDWDWVATHENPYREWIGAQIRADSFGYAAPGEPELAAEFAWRDARLSHVKNGVYGEMLVAAMIAAAFALDDPAGIVRAALAEIPSTSRLHRDVEETVAACARLGNDPARFEETLDGIESRLGRYDPVHANNNAAVVVAALLLGGRDFEKVITIAVMGGWDTDCNGATAGSIAGAMLGAGRLPRKWTAPLHDTLNSGILGYHPIAISECARRSAGIAREVLAAPA